MTKAGYDAARAFSPIAGRLARGSRFSIESDRSRLLAAGCDEPSVSEERRGFDR